MKKRLFSFILFTFFLIHSSFVFAEEGKIALIMKASINPFFMVMKKGAIDCAKKCNIPLDVFSIRLETDVDKQISIMQNLIKSSEYRVIILAPVDSKSLVPTVREALEKGIYIINIDNKLDDEAMKRYGIAVPFIGPDNFSAAKEVGEYVKFKLKGKGNVIIMEGITSAENAILRKKGFEKGLSGANINIVSYLHGEWHRNKAFNETLSFFKSNSQRIDAILCANDEMALGVIQALDLLGKRDIIVTGYDNIREVRTFLALHRISATVEQNPYIMGFLGVKYGKILMEEGNMPHEIKIPTILITYETFGKKIGLFLLSNHDLWIKGFIKSMANLSRLFGEEFFIKYINKLKEFKNANIDVSVIISQNNGKLINNIKSQNTPTVIVKPEKVPPQILVTYIMNKIADLFIGWKRTYENQKEVDFINWK